MPTIRIDNGEVQQQLSVILTLDSQVRPPVGTERTLIANFLS